MVAPVIIPVAIAIGATVTVSAVIITTLRIIKMKIFKKFEKIKNRNLKNCESLIIISDISKQCEYEKKIENIVKAD
ncbi:hypothetical protein CRE_04288 [Caenorhabditis remanei]|uniref:Uncharacterized protein n=1 Tax=Caenorhabditis remanei TaxID=31234 RepID=E3NAR0_CAERE|nr:hypothetical protein CRE_04288 [Caenorhabditis remanei]